ncbi:MAG: UDP-N-acetylglucosamine 2-epimerase, partial [Dehalococcoidia bacterium]|nr:UDP-N-acetylglucosamine 2-epimerase [Dehalococcoidia bacterium]
DHFLHLFTNLPPEIYTKLMFNCACMVGNSSSAIREGALMGVPTVNIGSRQSGREQGRNVINVGYERKEIMDAIVRQVNHGKYPADNIYGDGKAGERIADILAVCGLAVQKQITY